MKNKNKIVVNIGHGHIDRGAISVGNESEWTYNSKVSDKLVPKLKKAGYHVDVVSQTTSYSALPSMINAKDPDIILSLHFNAASASAHGTEMLHHEGSHNGERLAKNLQKEVLKALGTRDRGVKGRVKGDRGSSLLRNTAAPAVILEPFFGTNTSDWDKGKNINDYTDAIVNAVDEYFG